MPELDTRRYRITGVLGQGGFGKVYRATLEGAGGFQKTVAIKLLLDEAVPEIALRRFWDEARILGLIRDRALVNVDPPTRLAGRWAVVMEYVDGASIHQLLKLGPIPAAAVAEIVQEVARVLDKVYRAPGATGEPLRLLHRDIKPANLQVTADGEVKVLDFGIAKAEFASREAVTSEYAGGTHGFIAPERLEGTEGPAGDIFSLGVTAHLMVAGERPTKREMMGLEAPNTAGLAPDVAAVVELASRMRAIDPELRPSAVEVEEACARIRRASDGPTLRRWAQENVPAANALDTTDAMVGSVLSGTLHEAEVSDSKAHLTAPKAGEEPGEPGGRGRWPWIVAALLVVGGTFAVGAGTALLGGVLLVGMGGSSTEPTDQVVAAPVPEPEVAPVPVPVPEPEPEPEVAPAPEPVAPVAPRPAPAPRPAAEPQPAPKAATFPVTLTSDPLGCEVSIDGRPTGTTPVIGIALAEGDHRAKMVCGADSSEKTITVGRRSPTRYRYVVKDGGTWEAHY